MHTHTHTHTAVFFLLIGAKETEKGMEVFIRERILEAGSDGGHRDAIRRYKALWDSRYHVWPRMEERAQKMFNTHSELEEKKREVLCLHVVCIEPGLSS